MRMVITREEAMDMEDAHAQGLHEETPRDGCPTCQRRELRSYPTAAEVDAKQPGIGRRKMLTVTYSSAAPYIREALLNAAGLKLHARTQRDRKEYVGEMMGLVRALKILLASPEGQESPVGFPEFHGAHGAYEEVERFVGGEHEMIALGFKEAS